MLSVEQLSWLNEPPVTWIFPGFFLLECRWPGKKLFSRGIKDEMEICRALSTCECRDVWMGGWMDGLYV